MKTKFRSEILLLEMMSLLYIALLSFFTVIFTSNQENKESRVYKAWVICLCFSSGLKTYLISGRKLEHNVQCGCSQVGLSGGDFVAISLSSCPQPCTPDLIPGGAQAAEPLLPHQPPDRIGVSQKKLKVEGETNPSAMQVFDF